MRPVRTKSRRPVMPAPIAKTFYEDAYGMDLSAMSGVVSYSNGVGPSDSKLVRQRQASRRRTDGLPELTQRVLMSARLGRYGAVVTMRLPESGYRTVFVCADGVHDCWVDFHSGPAAAVRAHAMVLRWLQPVAQADVPHPLSLVRAICDANVA